MSIVGTSRLHGRDAEEYEGQKTDTARPSVRLDAQTEKGFRGTALTYYRVDIREVAESGRQAERSC